MNNEQGYFELLELPYQNIGVEITKGYIANFSEIKKKIIISRHIGKIHTLTMSRKVNEYYFNEFNVNNFPREGESTLKIDYYSKNGNIIQVQNNSFEGNLELLLSVYRLEKPEIGTDIHLIREPKRIESELDREVLTAKGPQQFVFPRIKTPENISELKRYLASQN